MATETTKIPFVEGAAAATPASGRAVIYAKADGLMYSKDDAGVETLMSSGAGSGGVATDPIWDAAGDLVQGTGANTAAKLTAGTAGQFLKSAGAAAANLWGYAPGTQLDYAEFTSATTSITATTEGTANAIVTGNSITYDGTAVIIEFYAIGARPQATLNALISYYLYEDGGSIGRIGTQSAPASANTYIPTILKRKHTPSAGAHTYAIRAATTSGTAIILAGAGGNGADMPGYIRVTKA